MSSSSGRAPAALVASDFEIPVGGETLRGDLRVPLKPGLAAARLTASLAGAAL